MSKYFIADASTLTEAQVDAINRRGIPAGEGTSRWVAKVRHPDGRVAFEIPDSFLGELGTKTVDGQRVVTDAECAIIQPNLVDLGNDWKTADAKGVLQFTYI